MYFVRPLEYKDSKSYDGQKYYSDKHAAIDEVWCGNILSPRGTRDASYTRNYQLIQPVVEGIATFLSTVKDLIDEDMSEEDAAELTKKLLQTYFVKKDGSVLTNSEMNKLLNLIYQYTDARDNPSTKIAFETVAQRVVDILNLLDDPADPFKSVTITGAPHWQYGTCIFRKRAELAKDVDGYGIAHVVLNVGTEVAVAKTEEDLYNPEKFITKYVVVRPTDSKGVIDQLTHFIDLPSSPKEYKYIR